MKSDHIYIRPLRISDAEQSLNLQINNREFFEKYSMTRKEEYYTLKGQINQINSYLDKMKRDETYYFGVFRNEDNLLVGSINLFQLFRDDLQSAFIGYFLDKDNNGKGYASEAVQLIVKYAFNEINLHRIEAGVMPWNKASIRVLEKSGFHTEGISKKNVRINGKWEDHQILAIVNPND